LPPELELRDQEAPPATPFRIAENCWLPPAGTAADGGLTVRPSTVPTVTRAVLEVTVPLDDELEEEEELVWLATAVTATSPNFPPVTPHELDGTAPGAV